jgi:hypothetical protein
MSAENTVRESILEAVRKDATLAKLVSEGLENGSYGTAEEYALRLGEVVSDVLKRFYPDEIPKEAMQEAVSLSNELAADVTTHVQEALNASSGVGLGVQLPDADDMSFSGFTDYSEAGQSAAEDALKDAIKDHLLQKVDSAMKKNAEQNSKLGLDAKIIRKAEAPSYPSGKKRVRSKKGKVYEYAWSKYGSMYLEPCPFCQEREGTYDYEDVRSKYSEVYRRHKRCRCEITYVQGKILQDVLTRSSWSDDDAEGRRTAINDTLTRKEQEDARRQQNRETKMEIMNRLQRELGWSAKGSSIWYEQNKGRAEYTGWDYLIEMSRQNLERSRALNR